MFLHILELAKFFCQYGIVEQSYSFSEATDGGGGDKYCLIILTNSLMKGLPGFFQLVKLAHLPRWVKSTSLGLYGSAT